MKYKVLKGTKLFNDLVAVQKKIYKVDQEALKLADSLGFKKIRGRSFAVAGGVSSFHSETQPKDYGYTYGSKKSTTDFFPKKIKANKEILDKIKALPVVEYSEINDLLKYDERALTVPANNGRGGQRIFFVPAIHWKRNMILIGLHEGQERYKPVKSMIEIKVSDYNKLTKTK